MAGGSLLPKTRSHVVEIDDQSEFEQMSGERWSGARGHDIPRREARPIGVDGGCGITPHC